jgi:hypothetical protein
MMISPLRSPVAISFPSFENAALVTAPLWPWSAPMSFREYFSVGEGDGVGVAGLFRCFSPLHPGNRNTNNSKKRMWRFGFLPDPVIFNS